MFGWRARLRLALRRLAASPFVRIDNLTDQRYIGSVIVNAANGRHYASRRRGAPGWRARASYAF